jgi:cysteine desulfurase
MSINNEIGSINNIAKIARVCHDANIPLHSDCVQSFGKFQLDLSDVDAPDSISASFHKFHGPVGAGLLIINNTFLHGYKLEAMICGSQQFGLRGGTESMPSIVGSVRAFQIAHQKRKRKNARLWKLKHRIISQLGKEFTIGNYIDYINEKSHNPLELIILGPTQFVRDDYETWSAPNTILLAIAKNKGTPFCNMELREFLESHKIIIGIGSACLTSSPKASHVLDAIRAPPVIKRGVIRISMSDYTTIEEVDKFVNILIDGIRIQED